MDHFYPFPSVSGDRKVRAKDVADLFSTFFASGVSPAPASSLQVIADQGMTIRVQPGACCINGYVGRNDAVKTYTLGIANGLLSRIDRVVLQCDQSGRKIAVCIKAGQPAATPIAPALQRDALIYELALADILVGKGVSAIQQSVITDRRPDTELCGWMGLIKNTDTSGLFAQWGAAFQTWFEGIQGIMNENIASNIAQTLWEHEERLNGFAAGSMALYTHQRVGTQHRFIGNGALGRALITAAFQAGDTFAVNGATCTAFAGGKAVNDLPLGHWVSFTWDGANLDMIAGMPTLRIVVSSTQPPADPNTLWVKP